MNKNFDAKYMTYANSYVGMCERTKSKPNKKFVLWICKVEQHVFNACSMHLTDLPDQPYMSNFEENMSSDDMATQIVNDLFGVCGYS
jgi:hypothetical protein